MRQPLGNSTDLARLERWGLWAAIGLLALAIAWTLVRFVSLFVGGDSWSITLGPGNRAVASAPKTDTTLATHHLFGAAPEPINPAIAINAPETELDLELKGTVTAADRDEALAIIADESGRSRMYSVGDELPGAASLYRVYAERVLLRTAEGVESLSLRPENAADDDTATAAGRARADPINVLRPSGDQRINWAAARRTLLSNPARIAKTVSALPVTKGGDLIGFRLRSGRAATLLSRLGLRQTDVIMAVNGIKLTSYGKAGEVVAELRTASQLNITVLRNGQKEQISISLNH